MSFAALRPSRHRRQPGELLADAVYDIVNTAYRRFIKHENTAWCKESSSKGHKLPLALTEVRTSFVELGLELSRHAGDVVPQPGVV